VSISSTPPGTENLPQPILDAASDSSLQSKPPWQEELGIFASTFFTIFLAELGDKTQVTTLLLSAQSHAPWIVFAGAGSALVATSLIGVLLGRWLAQRVPPRTLEVAAGILLVVLAVLLVWDVVQG
jgi:putative Ca2+/H+ antiporter (TMEM165/GDT1 family)